MSSDDSVKKRQAILEITKSRYPDYSIKAETLRVMGLCPDSSPPSTPTTEGSKRTWERNFFVFKSQLRVWESFYADNESELRRRIVTAKSLWDRNFFCFKSQLSVKGGA